MIVGLEIRKKSGAHRSWTNVGKQLLSKSCNVYHVANSHSPFFFCFWVGALSRLYGFSSPPHCRTGELRRRQNVVCYCLPFSNENFISIELNLTVFKSIKQIIFKRKKKYKNRELNPMNIPHSVVFAI